jgi:uncharacterized protein YdaU (DUF1376 family)
MNYYEHHLGDYMRDTAHLSLMEDGVYRRLIDAYYAREKPLPANVADCCKLARVSGKTERDAVQYVLREFFQLAEDGWRQKRCDEVIEKYNSKKAKAKQSADARWDAMRTQCERNANAMRTQCDGNAPNLQSPVTSNQEPEKNTSASATPTRTKVSRVTVDQGWMLHFKLAYPNRAGDQGWRKAERAANARIAEGHTPEEFIAGAKRYASFCQSTEKTGSEFVQQAATFLGPGKPFLLPWHPPPKVEQLSPVERVLRANGGVKRDERVVSEQFGSTDAGMGVLDGDVRDAPYAGFRRIGS